MLATISYNEPEVIGEGVSFPDSEDSESAWLEEEFVSCSLAETAFWLPEDKPDAEFWLSTPVVELAEQEVEASTTAEIRVTIKIFGGG